MKAIKLLDLKNASPDSRLCKTVTVPVLWSGHDSLSPGCYSAVAFTSVCRVAELQNCNNSGYHLLWLSGCCWWHGRPAARWCAVADLERNKLSQDCRYIQIAWLMEGTIICVTWTLWLVAASALIITLVGHYYQIAIMTDCGCPPSWWPWWPWPTSTAAGTWSCARHWGTNTS